MAASSGQGSQDPARVDPIWQMGAAPRTGPGAPRSSGVRREPLQLCGHVKNTFIHVSPADCEGGFTFPLRRQVSAPASTSTSRSLSKTESESTVGGVDSRPSFPTGGAPAKQEQALSDTSDEDDLDLTRGAAEHEGALQEGKGSANRRRRSTKRPTKSQRAMYRRLKGYLEADVRRDPHGFDFSKCYLPPSLVTNAAHCAQLAAGLEEYRNNLLSEGAVPVAGDASQSLGPSSLPAPGQATGSKDSPSISTAPSAGTFSLRPLSNGQRTSRENIMSL